MRMTLDRQALAALIKSDPNFEFELKASVASEVVRRMFGKDAAKIMAAANKEMFEKAVIAMKENGEVEALFAKAASEAVKNRTVPTKLSQDLIDQINLHVSAAKASVAVTAATDLAAVYSDMIRIAAEKMATEEAIQEKVDARIDYMLDQLIEKRVTERFEARMAEMQAFWKK